VVASLSHQGVSAQLSYSYGQNISPGYEGWEQNEDGSFSFLFGYMNRNWLEEIDVPIGTGNMISPGPADQGQPTHFLPRRNRFTFKVRVPADWGDKEMVWTLTTAGVTEYAYASLRTDYKVDNMVIASETGALGAGTSSPETRSNMTPVLRIIGDRELTARVGQPITLVAELTDDGKPRRRGAARRARADSIAAAAAAAGEQESADASDADASTTDAESSSADATDGSAEEEEEPEETGPRLPPRALRPPSRVTVGKVVGLHLSWFVYRAPESGGAEPEEVSFDPIQVKVWEDTRAAANSPWGPLWAPPEVPEDGRYEVQVTFTRPGRYVLRARGDDGALYVDEDVIVNVTTLLN
jgi:hypothetical protein